MDMVMVMNYSVDVEDLDYVPVCKINLRQLD
jgi:hypothetical protein